MRIHLCDLNPETEPTHPISAPKLSRAAAGAVERASSCETFIEAHTLAAKLRKVLYFEVAYRDSQGNMRVSMVLFVLLTFCTCQVVWGAFGGYILFWHLNLDP